jgi:NADH-quinone oxidoreductase subunit J
VLLLIASFGALSGLYVLLDAPFLAVIQIIVYAGAIMVLFLFVVMLLNAPHEETDYDERVREAEAHGAIMARSGPMRFGAALAAALIVELVWALTEGGGEAGSFAGASVSSVRAIGRSLFTDYAFAFEVTSVLILVAMVGAVLLAGRDVAARGRLEPLRGAQAPSHSTGGEAPARLNERRAAADPTGER